MSWLSLAGKHCLSSDAQVIMGAKACQVDQAFMSTMTLARLAAGHNLELGKYKSRLIYSAQRVFI